MNHGDRAQPTRWRAKNSCQGILPEVPCQINTRWGTNRSQLEIQTALPLPAFQSSKQQILNTHNVWQLSWLDTVNFNSSGQRETWPWFVVFATTTTSRKVVFRSLPFVVGSHKIPEKRKPRRRRRRRTPWRLVFLTIITFFLTTVNERTRSWSEH